MVAACLVGPDFLPRCTAVVLLLGVCCLLFVVDGCLFVCFVLCCSFVVCCGVLVVWFVVGCLLLCCVVRLLFVVGFWLLGLLFVGCCLLFVCCWFLGVCLFLVVGLFFVFVFLSSVAPFHQQRGRIGYVITFSPTLGRGRLC